MMNLEYKHLLPQDFSPESRVWIYQSSRQFSIAEAIQLEGQIADFCEEWMSHGDKVSAYGNLFFGRFIVLIADESACAVSGCSTDSSVRFIKDIAKSYQVDLFNRIQLAFVVKDKIEVIPMSQLNYAVEHGYVSTETLFFNNLVLNKKDLEENWIVPVKNSWLMNKIKVAATS